MVCEAEPGGVQVRRVCDGGAARVLRMPTLPTLIQLRTLSPQGALASSLISSLHNMHLL